MSIPLAKWQAARADYVEGNGSLRVVAVKHDLKLPTTEKRAVREGWTQLRSQRDEALRMGATPPPLPASYSAPASRSEPLSANWLDEKRQKHFLDTQTLIEAARAKLKKKLEADDLDCDELARLASALGALAETETKILGIRDTRKDKPRRQFITHGCPEPMSPAEEQQFSEPVTA